MGTGNPMFCVRCGQPRRHAGRGMCKWCYWAAERDGTLADYPRSTRSLADTIDTYNVLRARNPSATRREIAAQMGMSYKALDRAVFRYRAKLRTGVDVLSTAV